MNAPYDEPVLADLANREAEHAVLGALLTDNRLFDVVGDMLLPKHFSSEFDGGIYASIASQINACKPCDTISVLEQMQGRVELQYLAALTSTAVVSQSLTRRHAEIVVQRHKTRELLTVVDEARETAHDNSLPIEERVEQVTSKLAGLLEDLPGEDWVGSDAGMVEFIENVQRISDGQAPNFMPTGLRDLDEKLDGGLRDGELVIIGGRPSMGKTALAVTLGMNISGRGDVVAMFSLEMARAELQNRQVSMVSHIHLSKIKRPERMSQFEWSRMTDAVEQIRRQPFYVNDKPGLNINQLRAKARALKRRHGLRMLIVDYLGLMDGTDPKANRNVQLGEITRNLKKLAKELSIPILVLAQLNREVDKRPGQIPILSDLRDCGEIEQDADIVLFPVRPIHANPSLGPEWAQYCQLRIGKQRGGATGDVHLRYVGENVQFLDWEGDKPSSFGRQKSGDSDFS